MKLYELFPDFTRLSYSKRVEFLRSYRAKRALELEENIKNKKESSRVTLSDEEKALIKMLGITQKDLKALKGSIDNEQ
ncbi:MAG: hypothetical protein IMF19_11050 [Proteobacteria bacterium]|nr:hypothetical protein [Pseudomonadota bacterium]